METVPSDPRCVEGDEREGGLDYLVIRLNGRFTPLLTFNEETVMHTHCGDSSGRQTRPAEAAKEDGGGRPSSGVAWRLTNHHLLYRMAGECSRQCTLRNNIHAINFPQTTPY